MWVEITDFGGPPLTFRERTAEALRHAVDECEKVIKEAVEQAFPDGKFPQTKFWVEHGGKEILRSFDGLIISPYAHHEIFPQETYGKSLMFALTHQQDPFTHLFLLLPNGLHIFAAIMDENYSDHHPIMGDSVKAPPIALLLLANEIIDAINAKATQKEKSEKVVAAETS
jgi:hypothetical protein